MFLHTKNGVVHTVGGDMDYIRFGRGSKNLIILPGLGDGLKTVRGTALPLALMYRAFSAEYTVYAFSRSSLLHKGSTTRDMAADVHAAMQALGIARADVIGVSMGGMIAQHLAADFPKAVGKLVLAVTCAQPNPTLEAAVGEWIRLARLGDHTALMQSNMRLIYSPRYCRQNGWLVPLIGRLTRPASYARFFIHAEACLKHDAHAKLARIQSPTLVIGGEKDLALGAQASYELARAIPGAALVMYPQWGHGLYEEARDFQKVILDFLRQA